jgi:ribosome maturation factor RimP
MPTAPLRDTIRELLGPTIERLGFDLVAIELLGGGRRPTLRLSIDKPGGVDASDCARVTHRVSPLLDEADPIPSAYDLEVSSPGIERPVQGLADFARFAGLRVRLRLEEGLPRRRYTGRIVGVDGDTVEVEVDGVVHPIAFGSIDAAHLVLDLDEYRKLAEGPAPAGETVVPSDREPMSGEGDASAGESDP